MVILQHIPHWVFVVFFGLLALGVRQSLPHQLSLTRVTVLPLAMLGLSLAGVMASFGQAPLALLAWGAGLVAAGWLGLGRVDTTTVRYLAADQRFQMPGSLWPLALMMGLFCLKFAVGMALALAPGLRQSAPLMAAASAAFGLCSGLFGIRALALWALARRGRQVLQNA